MTHPDPNLLSRRERQIVDILYELGEGAVAEVQERLPDPPSYSSVRAMLAKLERKGHIQHFEKGLRYVFRPVIPKTTARDRAVERMIRTFFDGSVSQAINGLLGKSAEKLSAEELEELRRRIEESSRERS